MSKLARNQECTTNAIWQRNLTNARSISINIDEILFDKFSLLRDVLNHEQTINESDPVALLLSLYTCIGHLANDSTVFITNHSSNLNIFLLLIGPSGKI